MYGLLQDGEPFKVFVRREPVGSGLVLRFECKDGMGVLGVRRPGKAEPAPVAAYEEEGVDPAALRAGRFVHVLGTGQRQSYALSRLSADISGRIPTDRWIELEPQTEYGFRYLVAAEKDLDKTTATVAVGAPASPGSEEQITVVSPPRPPGEITGVMQRSALESLAPSSEGPAPLGDAALAALSREQAVQLVRTLQQRLAETEEALRKSRLREKDLLELLTRWTS